MSQQQIDVKTADIMTAVHNYLAQRFFKDTRSNAKLVYNELRRGDALPILKISAGAHGDVQVNLALDDSAFRGSCRFRYFRDTLAAHLHRVGETLKAEQPLNVYMNETGSRLLVNHPGLADCDGEVNILVTTIRQPTPGELLVTLTYLDPDQLARK